MKTLKHPLILPLFSLLCVLGTVMIGSTIPRSISKNTPSPTMFMDSTESASLNLLGRAIGTSLDNKYFTYTSSFENPFRLWNDEPKKTSSQIGITQASPRKKLFLKGLLSRDKALAILDNGLGETQIRAVGDTAFGQSVLKITDTSVTLRDRFGNYEIVVEDH